MWDKLFRISRCCVIALIFFLSACGGGASSNEDVRFPDEVSSDFQFSDESSKWSVGYANYPAASEEDYELRSGIEQLPSPLNDMRGLNVSGNNRSDDLFMFVKRKFQGFEPNRRYELAFELTFATNGGKGCVGVGGSPGESVFVKAGASAIEPLAIRNSIDFYLMNIDKGMQSNGGSDAIVIGDFSSSTDCNPESMPYELKTLNNDNTSFTVFTNAQGELWLMFGTDSGFESTTSIYYLSGSFTARRI